MKFVEKTFVIFKGKWQSVLIPECCGIHVIQNLQMAGYSIIFMLHVYILDKDNTLSVLIDFQVFSFGKKRALKIIFSPF